MRDELNFPFTVKKRGNEPTSRGIPTSVATTPHPWPSSMGWILNFSEIQIPSSANHAKRTGKDGGCSQRIESWSMRDSTFEEDPAGFRSGNGAGRAALVLAGSFGMSVYIGSKRIQRRSDGGFKRSAAMQTFKNVI